MNKKLEQHNWFPYIAWTLAIGFSVLVFIWTMELRELADDLQDSSRTLDYRLQVVEDMFAEEEATTTANGTENPSN